MAFIIHNETEYTTRSVRAVFAWAWRQVSKEISPAMRDKADEGSAVLALDTRASTYNITNTRLRVPPKGNLLLIPRGALALWARRAGMKKPWKRANAFDISTAPELKLRAAAKPKASKPKPPPLSKAQEAISRWEKKLERKRAHLGRIEESIEKAEKRRAKAEKELRHIESQLKRAQTRAEKQDAAPSTELSDQDYAARMRAKREKKSAAPAAG
jgi:hypothetical protein